MVLDPSTGEMVTAPEYGGTLTYARPGASEHCDVWSISGFATFYIAPVVEKLVIGDWAIGRSEHNWRSYNVPFSVMQGQLAESWETPDATTIIVKVRPGVYWHDKPPMNGRELTASDIEFNYHRLLGLGSGFSEPTPFSWTLPAVTSVTATDKSTVVFKLTRPDLFGVRKAFDTWDTWDLPSGGHPATRRHKGLQESGGHRAHGVDGLGGRQLLDVDPDSRLLGVRREVPGQPPALRRRAERPGHAGCGGADRGPALGSTRYVGDSRRLSNEVTRPGGEPAPDRSRHQDVGDRVSVRQRILLRKPAESAFR